MIKPLKNWYVTSPWGSRIHPTSGNSIFHYGIDLRAPVGTPIFSPESGIIEDVNYNSLGGHQLFVEHNNNYRTTYSHLSTTAKNIGDQVIKGEILGYTGESGNVTGPHLHYTVRFNGVRIDPETINYEILDTINNNFDKNNLRIPLILLFIVGIGLTLILRRKN